ELEKPEEVMNEIFDQYLLMYSEARYVHGDLSGYIILWWQDKPWIIDVPQGEVVNKWSNMNKVELMLRRDIKNVLKYFKTYGIDRDPEHILDVFLETYIPPNLKNYRELRKEGLELL
ncbi:MAG: RIO1 family regulatory kinase/ATPase domain-containing protein, partial [Candidatus Thorarchaeota archaeon]